MIGLILLQINITGDIQKDQQLLLYGIGGLISLIVLAMIIIVIIVLVRKSRRNKNEATLQASTAPPQTKQEIEEQSFGPAPAMKTEDRKPQETKVEQPKEEPKPVIEEKPEPIIAPVEEKIEPLPPVTEENKFDLKSHKQELDNQNPADKMEEIRRRLEEIRSQKNTDPVPVLPKITAKPRTVEPTIQEEKKDAPDPIFDEDKPVFSEEIDETIIVEDSESVAIPITDTAGEIPPQAEVQISPETEETTTVVDEGIMKEVPVVDTREIPTEQELITETIDEKKDDTEPPVSHLPNGKYLPMKKLTFAEWVELFK